MAEKQNFDETIIRKQSNLEKHRQTYEAGKKRAQREYNFEDSVLNRKKRKSGGRYRHVQRSTRHKDTDDTEVRPVHT